MSKHCVDLMLFTTIVLLSADLTWRSKEPQLAQSDATVNATAAELLAEAEAKRETDAAQQAEKREEVAKVRAGTAERRVSEASAAREQAETEPKKQAALALSAQGQMQSANAQAAAAEQRADHAEAALRRLRAQRNKARVPQVLLPPNVVRRTDFGNWNDRLDIVNRPPGRFFGAPAMARSAVTGAIWSGWCPTDDLGVGVLYGRW
jgi:hypothetical protein